MESIIHAKDLGGYLAADPVLLGPAADETEPQKAERERGNEMRRKADAQCRDKIIQKLAESHVTYAMGTTTARGLWKKLEETFRRTSRAAQMTIKLTLLSPTAKHKPGEETLEQYFGRIDKLVRSLENAGGHVPELDKIMFILINLPSQYRTVTTALETVEDQRFTLENVKRRLLDEEAKIQFHSSRTKQAAPSNTAFGAQSSSGRRNFSQGQGQRSQQGQGQVRQGQQNQGQRGQQGGNRQFDITQRFPCFTCGKKGHWRKNCPEGKKAFNTEVEGDQKQESANAAVSYNFSGESSAASTLRSYCFSVDCEPDQVVIFDADPEEVMCFQSNSDRDLINFCVDSGCTEHLCNDRSIMVDLELLAVPVSVQSAKCGERMSATHKGTIHLTMLVEGSEINLTLKNVLCVPDLHTNLLSVRKFDLAGCEALFGNRQVRISMNGELVAAGTLLTKLYFIQMQCQERAHLTTDSEELWHRRLGHASKDAVRKMSRLVEGLGEASLKDVCHTCVEGKQTKLPHNQTRTRATRPLELVHSDLAVVNQVSYDSKKYVCTFIDDYTHFAIVYCIESKSEVFECFKTYEAAVTAHFNLKLSRLRCDNGGEYVSAELKNFCNDKGIMLEYAIRYTPEQNGVAERFNRTLMDKARCMLLSSGLPKNLWSEAVLAAVFLINRSPTAALESMVPAEAWNGVKPNLSKVRIFGSLAFLKTPKKLCEWKLGSRSQFYFLVGYCPNGYRLWEPVSGSVIPGRDVTFDERFNYKNAPADYVKQRLVDFDEEDSDSESVEGADSGGEEERTRQAEPEPEREPVLQQVPVTRSGRQVRKPKHLVDYVTLATAMSAVVEDAPRSFAELSSRPDQSTWWGACKEEMSALERNGTYTLTKLPPGRKAIDCMWLFKNKLNAAGEFVRAKARLVAKGCSQQEGVDFQDTYAPVARMVTVRTLLAVINYQGLHASHLDIENAFLHGDLSEEIYMRQPPGFVEDPELVCRLHKSLYGLKQASRQWNQRFDAFVTKLGFVRSSYDKCLYILSRGSTRVYLLLYVDDILLCSMESEALEFVKAALAKEFPCKDLGVLSSFLGIDIKRSASGMTLSQPGYIKCLLERFGMSDCCPISTPMEKVPPRELIGPCIVDVKPYRQLVGGLLYLMMCSRPDISFAVNFYCRYQCNATINQWNGLLRVLRYLKGTPTLGLFYKLARGSPPLACYVDADWAEDTDDRLSTSGQLIEVFGSTVYWSTKKQSTVASSSTEAEYVSLGSGCVELIWLKNVLYEILCVDFTPVPVFEDNQSVIHCLAKWEQKRLKSVDVKYHLAKQLHETGVICVTFVPSNLQKADCLTKSLLFDKFTTQCELISLVHCP